MTSMVGLKLSQDMKQKDSNVKLKVQKYGKY
jgi:hypothetical protein